MAKAKRMKMDPPHPFGEAVEVQNHLLSRLLYPNPVCFLCSTAKQEGQTLRNVMTISWLTCIDNGGVFFASMNSKRSTASLLFGGSDEGPRYDGKVFTLSVGVEGMEDTYRKVGGMHMDSAEGRVDKFAELGLASCPPGGWGQAAPEEAEAVALDHDMVVAHMLCVVLTGSLEHDHHLLTCRIQRGWVRKRYWTGNTFEPTSPSLPSHLTFFGSGRFGAHQAKSRKAVEDLRCGHCNAALSFGDGTHVAYFMEGCPHVFSLPCLKEILKSGRGSCPVCDNVMPTNELRKLVGKGAHTKPSTKGGSPAD